MIYLTKKDSDKTIFLLNHKNIIKVEEVMDNTSNLMMTDGKILSVLESEEEIKRKAMDYDVSVIEKAITNAKGN